MSRTLTGWLLPGALIRQSDAESDRSPLETEELISITDPIARPTRSQTLLWWGAGLVAAAVLLGAAVTVVSSQPPGIERWWNQAFGAHLADWVVSLSRALDYLGGGWMAWLIVPGTVMAALVLTRRWRGAVFAGTSFIASAAAVQILKNIYGRARPENIMVSSDFGSYPSGHAANAATIAIVLYLLFPRVWVGIAGILWTVAMALSRTLLSAHWISDTIGAVLLGVGVVLVLAAWVLPWARTTSQRIPWPADQVR